MLLCCEENLREALIDRERHQRRRADDGSAVGSLAEAVARAGYSGGEAELSAPGRVFISKNCIF